MREGSRRASVTMGAVMIVLLGGPAAPGAATDTPIRGWAWALSAQGETELSTVARGIAQAWARGSDQAVASRLVSGQVRLYLEGSVAASLPNRQASAALREYLRGYQAGQVDVARVSLVEGSTERGFIELQWTARRAGTSQALRRTVFLGLRHDGRSWAVDEVRVMY